MSAARQFWDAIDRRKRERGALAAMTDDEIDDHDDDLGDELAEREEA